MLSRAAAGVIPSGSEGSSVRPPVASHEYRTVDPSLSLRSARDDTSRGFRRYTPQQPVPAHSKQRPQTVRSPNVSESPERAMTVVDDMWPVTFASVLNMSGIVSTAINKPTPSAGRPNDTRTGASMNKLALGIPGTLKLMSTAVMSTQTSAVKPTSTP